MFIWWERFCHNSGILRQGEPRRAHSKPYVHLATTVLPQQLNIKARGAQESSLQTLCSFCDSGVTTTMEYKGKENPEESITNPMFIWRQRFYHQSGLLRPGEPRRVHYKPYAHFPTTVLQHRHFTTARNAKESPRKYVVSWYALL